MSLPALQCVQELLAGNRELLDGLRPIAVVVVLVALQHVDRVLDVGARIGDVPVAGALRHGVSRNGECLHCRHGLTLIGAQGGDRRCRRSAWR